MNRMLTAGFFLVIVGACSAVQAGAADLHGDMLVALLKNDSQARTQVPSSSHGDIPAPATYADRGMSLGGGGGGGDVAAPTSTAPSAASESVDEVRDIVPTTPAPRTSAWRALLPGSIQ